MAEWKKVIVSGSSAELSSLSLDTALSVANGGTGATTLTDGGVLLGSGTGAITATAVLTNGQLLIGDGTGDPTVGTLSEGNGITVTNGAGSITLSIDGTDAVTFSNNTSIFSGSFSGSFEGDGSGLIGVSATSFDFDGLSGTGVSDSSVVDADLFAFSDAGTEKKITYAQLYGNIFGEVSSDATIAVGGALTIANDSVSNAKLANMTQGTVKVGGAGNAPTDLNAKTNGYILVGDGTDINSVAVGGDISLANDGTVTLGTVGADHITEISNLTADEGAQLENINSVTISNTQWGYVGDLDQALTTTSDVNFNDVIVAGDLTVQGAVTELQTTNLNVEDQFILLHSGSAANTSDSGIIFGGSGGTAQQGKALMWDSNYAASGEGRLAISTTDVAWNSTTDFAAGTNGYYVAGVFEGTAANAATAQADHNGNIRIESNEIYIYA